MVLFEYPYFSKVCKKRELLAAGCIRYCFDTASSQQRCVTLLIGKRIGEGWVMIGEYSFLVG